MYRERANRWYELARAADGTPTAATLDVPAAATDGIPDEVLVRTHWEADDSTVGFGPKPTPLDVPGVAARAADAHVPPGVALAATAAAVGVAWLLSQSRVRWVTVDGSDWTPGVTTAEAPPAGAGARPGIGQLGLGSVVVVATADLALIAATAAALVR